MPIAVPPSAEKHHFGESQLCEINERLSLALQGSRQIAFDWHIRDDRLYFSGELNDSVEGLLLDTSKPWRTSALPSIIHEKDQAIFRARLHKALKGSNQKSNDYHQVELRLKDGVGNWRWVDISGKIIERDDSGLALRMVGTFLDINERKKAERRKERLHAAHAMRSQTNQALMRTNNHNTLFREICRVAVEHGHFAAASICLVNQVSPVASSHQNLLETHDGDISEDRTIPQSHHVKDNAVAKNKPHVCNDLDRCEHIPHCVDNAAQISHKSVACFPLRLQGKPFGTLNLYGEEADTFDSQLTNLLEAMAADISFAIESRQQEAGRKAAESALRDNETVKSAIITAALDSIVSIDQNGDILSLNHAAESMFGYHSEAVIGRNLAELIIPKAWRERYQQEVSRFATTGESSLLNQRIELAVMRADGTSFPAEMAIVPVSVQSTKILTAFIRDITVRKQAEALQRGENRILNMVAAGAPLLEILTELALFAETFSNGGVCSIQQFQRDGITPSEHVAPSLPPTCRSKLGITTGVESVITADIAADPRWAGKREVAHKLGLRACASSPILSNSKKILGSFTLYFRRPNSLSEADMKLIQLCTRLAGLAMQSRASEERIRYLAHYDGLTSLPNRFLFKEYLDLALRNARRRGKKFAVLFMDLDKFKEINDTLGHDAGDLVLKEMAKRWQTCLRHSDKIARMGGDEFYTLIEDLHDGRDAAEVAQKLLDAAARPIFIGDKEHFLSVSIGISIYPDDGGDATTLLNNADRAMYFAKKMGKNAYQFFSMQGISNAADLALLRLRGRDWKKPLQLEQF